MTEAASLGFQPLSSAVGADTWHDFSQLKLNELQLSEAPLPISGSYLPVQNAGGASAPLFVLSPVSLAGVHGALEAGSSDAKAAPPPPTAEGMISAVEASASQMMANTRAVLAPGLLHNLNTDVDFKATNKAGLLAELGKEVWDAIKSGEAVKEPRLLLRFHILMFSDLKKWHFTYWFCFPTTTFSKSLTTSGKWTLDNAPLLRAAKDRQTALRTAYHNLCTAQGTARGGVPFFAVRVSPDGAVEALSLADAEEGLKAGEEGLVVAVVDPGTMDMVPASPVRNLLMLCAVRWKLRTVTVICYREILKDGSLDGSFILDVSLPAVDTEADAPPKVVGWETNAKGKLGPRRTDLGAMMDSSRLAEVSVDLNLKLMRWRLLPSLDVERIAATKCLLLGSGTLGCNVARALLGWGVKHITFCDNGKVSYSNPVRQSLFEFADAANGEPKATCAAAHVKKIHPSCVTEGHQFSIPMPGHSVEGDLPATTAAIALLDKLISEHDVVYLLTDTRESRWLPTVLCRHHNKPMINAAMGFDTYVVMRHGLAEDNGIDTQENKEEEGDGANGGGDGGGVVPAGPAGTPLLGCYFCSDVVAPTDSLTRRSLDEQCTVTRPGLSMITSAMCVELMVVLLHHPDGFRAPADGKTDVNATTTTPLGLVPHQVRGYLSHMTEVLVKGEAFDKCTGCSKTVVDAFRAGGMDFLIKVFNDPGYLEEVSGLAALKQAAEDMEWDDEDDDGDDF